jgi:hypothetical protein
LSLVVAGGASQAIGETRAEFLAPASHPLLGDDNTTLSQEQHNIPQAEAEHGYNHTVWPMISAGNRWR